QSDASKHPEVADSWVIVPEIVRQLPQGSCTPAFADIEQSALIAERYGILKFPALLFFRRGQFTGSLTGLLPWREFVHKVESYLSLPRLLCRYSPDAKRGVTREHYERDC
ncbi:MAG: hypothetical protein ACRC5A_08985, partial [Enterobacteriaceae bacterium]